MKIYLDDIRPTPPGYIRAYTYEDAIRLLCPHNVEEISLDHDLGEEKTGYDVLLWIEEKQMHGYVPPKMIVHSANPVGRMRMEQAIQAIENRRAVISKE